MDYKLLYDLHTHTTYSHGKGSILDNAKEASRKGLKTLGIADHGPGHKFYGIKMSEFSNMREDIKKAKEAFPDLDIKLGVEANIVNESGHLDVGREDQKLFDYIIAGYHYGVLGEHPFKAVKMCIGGYIKVFSDKSYNTDVIVKTLYENDIKILTHPDDKIAVDINEVARACEKTNTMMEINSHHLSLRKESIIIAAEYGVKFVLSSDAHRPIFVGDVTEALKIAEAANLPLERIDNLWSL